jgi:hypothetical protein
MKYFKILSITLSIMCLIGCDKDFLNKVPPDKLAEDGFLNSAARAKTALNGVYEPLASSNLATSLPKAYDVPSGEILLSNTEGLDFNKFAFDAADQQLLAIYSGLYRGVGRANTVITEVPAIDMDKALQSRYVAEAKFLRAFYYWNLTTLWGDVPLFTAPVENPDDALVAKTPIADIYKVIIKDLQDAEAVLPVSYPTADVGRATKGAAQALLGKVYLYAKDYVKAEATLGQVISSNTYGLMDEFDQIWNRNFENNKEIIFDVQFADIGGSGTTSRNGAFLPAVNGGTGSSLATQKIVDAFKNNDPRLGYSIFRDGDVFAPHLTTSNLNLDKYKSTWSSTGYNIRKGLLPIKYVSGSDINAPLIRFADVLLLYAEAANEIGLIDKARDAVNRVRQRPSVNMPPLTSQNTGTKAEMFNAIVYERQVELAFEGQRYNDLRRWGLAQAELGYLGYTAKHRYFPLPQLEIDINPKLVQNTGW